MQIQTQNYPYNHKPLKTDKAPISFASNIYIIPKDKFIKLYCSKNAQTAEMGELPVTGKTVGTYGLSCCVGGNVTNGSEAIAFHHGVGSKFHKDSLSNFIENSKNIVRGFLTGGYEDKTDPATLSKYFENLFKNNKIDYSIIANRIGGHDSWSETLTTMFFHSTEDDSYHMTTSGDIKTPEELVESFDIIHISDNDTLFLDEKKVDSHKLNTLIEARKSSQK